MKVFVIATVALLGLAGTTQAQLRNRNPIVVGVKGGGTAATFTNDESRASRFVFGGHGGLFVSIPLLDPFSVQPELLYSMKGSSSEEFFDGSVLKLRSSYLDVVLPFRVKAQGFFAEAGPQVGYLLSGSIDRNGSSVEAKDLFRTVDVGYVVGVGFQPPRGGLGFGLRYNGGVLSALNEDVTPATINPFKNTSVRNGAIQAYLTYSKNRAGKRNKKN